MSYQPLTMIELINDAVADHAGRVAVKCEDRQITFEDLGRLAGRVGAKLQARGVRPGDRVSLYAPNGIEWIAAYYGVLLSGAIVNPANALNTTEELEFLTRDCEARFVLCTAQRAESLKSANLPELMTIDAHVDGVDFASGGAEMLIPTARAPSDASTIVYTSGTTGRPKGATLSHGAVVGNALGTAYIHDRRQTDRFATGLPLAHAYGATVLNASIFVGGVLLLAKRFEARDFLEMLCQERATMMDGVPTMYTYLLGLLNLEEADLSSLRYCLVGGQAMPEAQMAEVEQRFKCPLVELWGMTEVAGLGASHDVRGGRVHGSIGAALPGMEVRIAKLDDPERNVATGEVGELMTRGSTMMIGYWGQPEATAECLSNDGWLATGDLGRMDKEGRVWLVDRKKDMILCGGYNVYPAEIERVLAQHPAVAMSAVGRMPDPDRGETPIAYVVLRPGFACSDQEIIEHCLVRLSRYKAPRHVRFVSDLPKTSSGKIMRRALGDVS